MHLLKAGSKPTTAKSKRKKIELMGTFDDYSKQKQVADTKAKVAEVFQGQNQINSSPSILQFMAPAPTTKETANKGKDAKMSGK